VEWSAALPPERKIANGQGKLVLRRVLARYVPDAVINRPKSGFGLPLGDWLRGPLRPWAEELLSPARLGREGFLRSEPIRTMWTEHQAGRRDREYHLWDVLMFQSWLESTQAPAQVVASA
jgi:asparagine synthase (glutamine-hydrolysing)